MSSVTSKEAAAHRAAASPYSLLRVTRPPWTLGPGLLLHVFHRVADRLDLLGLFVRDLHPELLLEAHDQLDQVERVCVEILHERGLWFHVAFVDAELLDDDL